MVVSFVCFGSPPPPASSPHLRCNLPIHTSCLIDWTPFLRATYVNQARVHQGYHYPRSLHTALKSAHCFRRFNEDYGFCINRSFEQVYSISSEMSWTNAKQFKDFCGAAKIPCEETQPAQFFRSGLVDAAYVTEGHPHVAACCAIT